MKKFEKNFLLLCDYVILGENNKLSLIGIFKTILLKDLPGVHIKSNLVGNYKVHGKVGDIIDVEIKYLYKGEQLSNISPLKLKIPVQKSVNEVKQLNFIVEIAGIKFEKEGEYQLTVKIDDENAGECDFEVRKV